MAFRLGHSESDERIRSDSFDTCQGNNMGGSMGNGNMMGGMNPMMVATLGIVQSASVCCD